MDGTAMRTSAPHTRRSAYTAAAAFATRWAAALLLAGCATTPAPPTEPVKVKVLAINDFHGNLKPPPGGIRVRDAAGKLVNVDAGGAEYLATAVAQLRALRRLQ